MALFLYWVAGWALMFGDTAGGAFGTSGFLAALSGAAPAISRMFLFQAALCAAAIALLAGAVAGRMTVPGFLLVAAFVSAFLYPLYGHWAWYGIVAHREGWMQSVAFLDYGGATVVHAVPAWAALAALRVAGPRPGRFTAEGLPGPVTAASVPWSVLGMALVSAMWIGVQGLFFLPPSAAPGLLLAGAGGLLTALLLSQLLARRLRVDWWTNGGIAGVVAASAGAEALSTGTALVTGAIAGALVPLVSELLVRRRIDDPVGVVSAHAVAASWGVVALGLFGSAHYLYPSVPRFGQVFIQFVGAAICCLWAFGGTWALLRIGGKVLRLALNADEQSYGLDVLEYAGARGIVDMERVMAEQAETGNLALRAPVSPASPVAPLARRYNEVIRRFEVSASRTDAIVRSSTDGIVTFNEEDRRITYANPSAEILFGLLGGGLVGQPLETFLVPGEDSLADLITGAMNGAAVEVEGQRPDGSVFSLEAVFATANIEDETLCTGTFRDISERKAAERALRESEERYMLAARGSNEGLWDWDLRTNKVFYSARWKTMLGFGDISIGDSPEDWFKLVHPEDMEDLRRLLMTAHMQETPHFTHEYRIRNNEGGYLWVLLRGLVVCDERNVPYRIAGSQADITERRRFEDQLQHDALHDTLTGLPNRALFANHLAAAIARTRRRPEYLFAVLFLDLDRFKIINDSLGHVIGDKLLKEVGERVRTCVRATDQITRVPANPSPPALGDSTVARLGGDEFAVFLDDLRSPEDASRVAERIQKRLSEPFTIDQHEIYSTVSIGIALSTAGYEQPDDLLRDSDTAMYRAKALGKARHAIFDKVLHDEAMRRLELENDLRRALERHELVQFYQPIIDIATGRIHGFEALVRWQHPSRGLVSPAEFIPVAEETGLITHVDWWALQAACNQMSVWRAGFGEAAPQYVSVNMSSKQFMQRNILEDVQSVIVETGLSPAALNLEILETVIMSDPDSVAKILGQLRQVGVFLSIDDFGTGYSSLSYLHQFPIDIVKVDRSFVSKIGPGGENGAIVEAILQLCRNLELRVTAEGIEEAHQLAFLRELGCDYAQGFYFSKPVPANDATRLIEAGPWQIR